jgi:hypothetical protein
MNFKIRVSPEREGADVIPKKMIKVLKRSTSPNSF